MARAPCWRPSWVRGGGCGTRVALLAPAPQALPAACPAPAGGGEAGLKCRSQGAAANGGVNAPRAAPPRRLPVQPHVERDGDAAPPDRANVPRPHRPGAAVPAAGGGRRRVRPRDRARVGGGRGHPRPHRRLPAPPGRRHREQQAHRDARGVRVLPQPHPRRHARLHPEGAQGRGRRRARRHPGHGQGAGRAAAPPHPLPAAEQRGVVQQPVDARHPGGGPHLPAHGEGRDRRRRARREDD